MSEWQSLSGQWHCNCIDNLTNNAGVWYMPARILNISPADYIKLILTKYKPDCFSYNKEKCVFLFSWSNQNNMRKFKNDINAAARKINFQI